MFQLAKWGALSHLVPLAITSQSSQTSSVDEACDMLFDSALESVNAAPVPALLALFETTIVSAKHYLGVNNTIPLDMLEKLCNLIFSSTLLLEEYTTTRRNGENEVIDVPILKAFN